MKEENGLGWTIETSQAFFQFLGPLMNGRYFEYMGRITPDTIS
jgi:hypothetical protein